ncbi:MAG TPA: ATP-binding protein [Candidatus Saccharimonadales bacterium]|jgi:signal transduction histidine kinase
MDLAALSDVRVLLVEDDEDDYLIMQRTLDKVDKSPFHLEWVDTFEHAKEAISQARHDIYLIDYRLGAHTGLELLKFAQPEKRTEPFILLTGVGSEAVEWQSLELAASDYLVKGAFDANLLSRTLYYALQRKRIEEQRLQYLVELNRSKDEFISIASHQLRTPATGVKQYVGMLLEGFVGELDPAQREILKKAYNSNERQLKIVSDLLKVAQVDAGKVKLRKEPVHVGEFVGDIVAEHHAILSDRGQTISYTPPGREQTVLLDANSVRMVIENLIDNASKYSEEGSRVEVSVTGRGGMAEIHVSDEGVGIEPDAEARVFEKFARIDNRLSTKVGGTGLGLYWVRKIIDLHGGNVTYQPNTPRGTTFIIRLPKGAKV